MPWYLLYDPKYDYVVVKKLGGAPPAVGGSISGKRVDADPDTTYKVVAVFKDEEVDTQLAGFKSILEGIDDATGNTYFMSRLAEVMLAAYCAGCRSRKKFKRVSLRKKTS